MGFLIHPCKWIDDEEKVHTPPKLLRYWEIYPLCPQYFPRSSRFPLGFALGKSLRSREISWASGMDFPIPPEFFWWSTDTIQTTIHSQQCSPHITVEHNWPLMLLEDFSSSRLFACKRRVLISAKEGIMGTYQH